MFQPQESIVAVKSKGKTVSVMREAKHLHWNNVAFLDTGFKIDNAFFSLGRFDEAVRDIGDFEAEQVANLNVFHLFNETPISIPDGIHPGESGISAERLAGFCANSAAFHDESDFGVDCRVDLKIVGLEVEPTRIRHQVSDGFQDGQGSIWCIGAVVGQEIFGSNVIGGPIFAELHSVGNLLHNSLGRSQFLRDFALYPSLQSFHQLGIQDCQKIGTMANESTMRQEEAFTI